MVWTSVLGQGLYPDKKNYLAPTLPQVADVKDYKTRLFTFQTWPPALPLTKQELCHKKNNMDNITSINSTFSNKKKADENDLKLSHRESLICINPRAWSYIILNIPCIDEVLNKRLIKHLTLRVQTIEGENRVAGYISARHTQTFPTKWPN